MKVVNVAISNIDMYSQFLALPARYEHEGIEWAITFTHPQVPIFRVKNSEYVFSHDMLIANRYDQPHQRTFDHQKRTWYLDRYNKVFQGVHLRNVTNRHGLHYYQELPVSSIDLTTATPRFEYEGCDDVVIKTIDGARSVGIVKVPKEVNLRSLITDMLALASRAECIEASPTATNEDYLNLFGEYGVECIVGSEKFQNELAEKFQECQWVIQKMNPHKDVVEFRALVAGDNTVMFARDHMGNDRKNICNQTMTAKNCEAYMHKEIYEEIRSFLAYGHLLTHGSVDIWYSHNAKRWGIYEYQNQYGHVYLSEKTHLKYLKDSLLWGWQRINGEIVFND